MLLVRHEWFVPTLLINLESITGKKINSVYLHNVRVNSAYTVPLVKQLDVWNDEEFISTVSQIYPTLPPNQSVNLNYTCLLYTSPSPRDRTRSRMPSSA